MSDRLPVRLIQHHADETFLTPQGLVRTAQIEAEYEAQMARIEAGEPREQVFGPALSSADLRAMILGLYDDNPGMAAKYKLPGHWHWMGPT